MTIVDAARRDETSRTPGMLAPLVASVLICGTALAALGAVGAYMGWGGSEYTRREMPLARKLVIEALFDGYHGVLLGLLVGAIVGCVRRWLDVRRRRDQG